MKMWKNTSGNKLVAYLWIIYVRFDCMTTCVGNSQEAFHESDEKRDSKVCLLDIAGDINNGESDRKTEQAFSFQIDKQTNKNLYCFVQCIDHCLNIDASYINVMTNTFQSTASHLTGHTTGVTDFIEQTFNAVNYFMKINKTFLEEEFTTSLCHADKIKAKCLHKRSIIKERIVCFKKNDTDNEMQLLGPTLIGGLIWKNSILISENADTNAIENVRKVIITSLIILEIMNASMPENSLRFKQGSHMHFVRYSICSTSIFKILCPHQLRNSAYRDVEICDGTLLNKVYHRVNLKDMRIFYSNSNFEKCSDAKITGRIIETFEKFYCRKPTGNFEKTNMFQGKLSIYVQTSKLFFFDTFHSEVKNNVSQHAICHKIYCFNCICNVKTANSKTKLSTIILICCTYEKQSYDASNSNEQSSQLAVCKKLKCLRVNKKNTSSLEINLTKQDVEKAKKDKKIDVVALQNEVRLLKLSYENITRYVVHLEKRVTDAEYSVQNLNESYLQFLDQKNSILHRNKRRVSNTSQINRLKAQCAKSEKSHLETIDKLNIVLNNQNLELSEIKNLAIQLEAHKKNLQQIVSNQTYNIMDMIRQFPDSSKNKFDPNNKIYRKRKESICQDVLQVQTKNSCSMVVMVDPEKYLKNKEANHSITLDILRPLMTKNQKKFIEVISKNALLQLKLMFNNIMTNEIFVQHSCKETHIILNLCKLNSVKDICRHALKYSKYNLNHCLIALNTDAIEFYYKSHKMKIKIKNDNTKFDLNYAFHSAINMTNHGKEQIEVDPLAFARDNIQNTINEQNKINFTLPNTVENMFLPMQPLLVQAKNSITLINNEDHDAQNKTTNPAKKYSEYALDYVGEIDNNNGREKDNINTPGVFSLHSFDVKPKLPEVTVENVEVKSLNETAISGRSSESKQHQRKTNITTDILTIAENRETPYWHSDTRKPRDCYEVSQLNPSNARNGLHKIFIFGLGMMVSVFCDMKNGGWTVILKREDGSIDFYRDWNTYTEGFGTPFSEHYIGNEVLHYLTNQRHYSLKVELTDWKDQQRDATYQHFWVDDEDLNFRLHVLAYSGSAGDGLGKHDGMSFSTWDRDNDLLPAERMGGNCAVRFKGAGWYYNCYRSNLMGLYYDGGVVNNKSFDGVAWKPWTGPLYSMKSVVMKIRPKNVL